MLRIPSDGIEDVSPLTAFQEDAILFSQEELGAATMRFVYPIAGFNIERLKVA